MKAWKLKVGQRRTPIVPLAHTLARVYLRLELKPIRVPWKVVMVMTMHCFGKEVYNLFLQKGGIGNDVKFKLNIIDNIDADMEVGGPFGKRKKRLLFLGCNNLKQKLKLINHERISCLPLTTCISIMIQFK
jgi:hypothetical protein